jgi:hypothetical protein
MASELKSQTVKLGNLLSVADQIQAFGLARKTGEIRATNLGVPARIAIVEGDVFDAQFGDKVGLEAAIEMINLSELQTEFVPGVRPPQRTIHVPFTQLLLAAANQLDESGRSILPPKKPEAAGHPAIRVMLDSGIRSFSILPGLAYVGRALSSDIVIPNQTVSERHASIERTDGGILLKDLNSTNGTYVNGLRVKESSLSGQMNLQFGLVQAVFIENPRQ